MMRVRLSATAYAELEQIADFIAKDKRTRARSFVEEMVERCLSLSDNPERYAVVAELADQKFRRAPYGNYLILYSVADDEVRIHHIVHSARDYLRVLFPDD